MRRRASDKFIPNGDGAFAAKATVIARVIARDPARFMLSAGDAEQFTAAAREFREALSLARRISTRTKLTIMRKDEVRKTTERIIRKFANRIRANDQISAIDKAMIYVYERAASLNERTCPQTRPLLQFVRSTGESGLTGGKHILRFCEQLGAGTHAKPDGAARIELFFELVPDGQRMPRFPGQYTGGWPWYLRSFTKNPIEVEFPIPAEAMLFVYWARWADAKGNFGPWSRPCRARVEGGFAAAGALPDQRLAQRREMKYFVRLLQQPRPALEHVDSDPLLLAEEMVNEDPVASPTPKQLPEAA
jgi:hypothetical protein